MHCWILVAGSNMHPINTLHKWSIILHVQHEVSAETGCVTVYNVTATKGAKYRLCSTPSVERLYVTVYKLSTEGVECSLYFAPLVAVTAFNGSRLGQFETSSCLLSRACG